MRRPRIVTLLLAALLVAACNATGSPTSPRTSAAPSGGGSPSVIPLIVTQEFGVGPNRAVFGLIDAATDEQLADPDRTLEVGFVGPGGETIQPVDSRFVWAIENERGVYAANVDFPVAGAWTAVFQTAAPNVPAERIQVGFDVKEDTSVLRPGDEAPAVDTPTAADVGGDLTRISTDTEPVAELYETSIADAVAAGEPFVVAFATPKFCTTAQCGPTLERVKEVAADHPDVTWINVEPYELEVVDGQLQPVLDDQRQFTAVEAVRAFGMLTEPYIFVVGADGKVAASFEVIFAEEELAAAVDAVS